MFKKSQSISLRDSCSALCNNFTVLIDVKRNVGHYGVVSRNILTISSSPLSSSSSAAKPVNRQSVLRDPSKQRLSHIIQVGSSFVVNDKVSPYRDLQSSHLSSSFAVDKV